MQDPLSVNIQAQGYDTSRPLHPEGDFRLQIVGSEIKPGSDKVGGILQWHLDLVTLDPATEIGGTGRDIPPNTKLFLDWPFDLAPREDSKYPDAWKTSLFNAVDAILGTDKDSRPDITKDVLDSAVGKIVMGTVKIDTDKEGTRRNKITRLKKA